MLLRWEHPEEGVLPPARFLSVLVQTGLIVPVGRIANLEPKALMLEITEDSVIDDYAQARKVLQRWSGLRFSYPFHADGRWTGPRLFVGLALFSPVVHARLVAAGLAEYQSFKMAFGVPRPAGRNLLGQKVELVHGDVGDIDGDLEFAHTTMFDEIAPTVRNNRNEHGVQSSHPVCA